MSRLPPDPPRNNLDPYAGRWVAKIGSRVVGQGGIPAQALQAAKLSRFKESPQVSYVPTFKPLAFSPILEQICAAMPHVSPLYLVGGAVRDAMIGHTSHDLDFVVPRDALQLSRRLADALGGAYYSLDQARGTGRVVITEPNGTRMVLDFAVQRGPTLETDLRARDFTINAMAVDVKQPQALLDPLGGSADLRTGKLRACSPTTFTEDPLRILRGVRLAGAYSLRVLTETRQQMGQAISGLSRSSPERLRDELFRMLDGPKPAASMRALDNLGVLPYVLPELLALKGVTQSPPHVSDVFEHTLDVIQKLETLLGVLAPNHDPETAANLTMGVVTLRLGRYRRHLNTHLLTPFTPDRCLRPLLFLAALYHDVSKPVTRQQGEDGRIHFYKHEHVGAKVASRRAKALRLSNPECVRIKTIIQNHMRPLLLAQTGQSPTRRAVYRFFRDTGSAGVDISLLSLADVLAAHGSAIPQDFWGRHLDVVSALLDAWWENRTAIVSPPSLLNGKDLIDTFQLDPGPVIGRLLEEIREAQANGHVHSKKEALELVRSKLETDLSNSK